MADLNALSAELESLRATVDKYSDIINALESEDYDSAVASLTKRIPIIDDREFSEITITIDNWDEYFEILPFEQKNFDKNGKVETGIVGVYALYLKDEYLPLVKYNGANVSFMVSVTYEFREFDYDKYEFVKNGDIKSGTRKVQELMNTHDSRDCMDTDLFVSTENGRVCAVPFASLMDRMQGYETYFLTFDVLEAVGTILIAQ